MNFRVRDVDMDEDDIEKPEAIIGGVLLDDFHAYMPQHAYIFTPSRELWPASSVNARIAPIKKLSASAWLDANRAVEQMTWCPGRPTLIEDRLISDGGWIERPGCRCFNLYRPPRRFSAMPARRGAGSIMYARSLVKRPITS